MERWELILSRDLYGSQWDQDQCYLKLTYIYNKNIYTVCIYIYIHFINLYFLHIYSLFYQKSKVFKRMEPKVLSTDLSVSLLYTKLRSWTSSHNDISSLNLLCFYFLLSRLHFDSNFLPPKPHHSNLGLVSFSHRHLRSHDTLQGSECLPEKGQGRTLEFENVWKPLDLVETCVML